MDSPLTENSHSKQLADRKNAGTNCRSANILISRIEQNIEPYLWLVDLRIGNITLSCKFYENQFPPCYAYILVVPTD